MKKLVFALEIMSLMLVLPVYMVVELNHPTTGTEKAVNVQKNEPGKKQSGPVNAGEIFPNSALATGAMVFTRIK